MRPGAAGRFRRKDERISVMDATHSVVLHTPPDADSLPARLERLCAFANQAQDTEPFVHPVVRAILVHFMLGYDHPFVDGNGRTARALFYWSVARSGYWLMEYLSISRLLMKAPAQYARAYLHTETDANDATLFHSLPPRSDPEGHRRPARLPQSARCANSEARRALLRDAPCLANQLNTSPSGCAQSCVAPRRSRLHRAKP